jgi:uncharacterized protein (TIGR00730 family)
MFKRFRRCCSDIFALMIGWIPVFFQIIYGLLKMSRLPKPRVTFFGGARFKQDDDYAQIAKNLAATLAGRGVSVITGGGPGIMEAANCGVDFSSKKNHAQTMGIMISDLNGETVNKCSQLQISLKYFFARKWLLTRYSMGFVVFPGGFGTLDELMEVLTLIKSNKLASVPIVLFGSEYWQPMIDWLQTAPQACGAVTAAEIKLMLVTDDIEKVVAEICDYCTKN